jgi:hypothetical protein
MCCALSSNDEEKLMGLHEKMGDLCSSLKAYSRAIDFYLKMLTVILHQNCPPACKIILKYML